MTSFWEKPISTKMDELLDLRRRAAAYPNQMVAVCHVLRHTAIFQPNPADYRIGQAGAGGNHPAQ